MTTQIAKKRLHKGKAMGQVRKYIIKIDNGPKMKFEVTFYGFQEEQGFGC